HSLSVERPLPEGAPRRLASYREGLDKDVVDLLAIGKALAEDVGLSPELSIGELLNLVLEIVDCGRDRGEATQRLALAGAQDLGQHHARSTPSSSDTPEPRAGWFA